MTWPPMHPGGCDESSNIGALYTKFTEVVFPVLSIKNLEASWKQGSRFGVPSGVVPIGR